MEEQARGRPVEKHLYLPVLNFGRLCVLGVFDPLHRRPEPGPCGTVAGVGVAAQANAFFRTLEIRQFCSFYPLASGPTQRSTISGKYRRNETPHQEVGGLAASHHLGYLLAMQLLSVLPVLIFSIVVHEVAHAWVALREGDDTAQSLGRITLNPISHLDPIGSFLVPMAMYFFTNGLIFGWAKPVPIDPRKFRDFRGGDIRVSLAGIVSNLILVVAFTLLVVVFVKLQGILPMGESTFGYLIRTARFGIFINLILAFFNLIPIPPLDGSHVLYHFLPRGWRATYQKAGRYGILVLIGLASFYPPFFSIVLWPVYALLGLADTFVELWI